MKILSNKEYEKITNEKPQSYTYYMKDPHQAKKMDELENQNVKLEIELDKKDKEIERLKEELKELNQIIEIGRRREYHSKFLKDFQKERGKNVFPDHDEIYKRYDDYKSRIDKAIEYIEESYNETVEGIEGVAKFFSKRNETLLKILKGVDKK